MFRIMDMKKKQSVLTCLDFSNICRICLNTNDLKQFDEYQILLQLFMKITNIEVDLEESLPRNVCLLCIEKLKDIGEFIETSKANDSSLRQVLPNIKVKEEYEDNRMKEEHISDPYRVNVYLEEPSVYQEDPSVYQEESKKCVDLKEGLFLHEPIKVEALIVESDEGDLKRRLANTCRACGDSFSTQRGLLSHLNLKLSCRRRLIDANDYFSEYSRMEPSESVEPQMITRFHCLICSKDFSNKSLLIKHSKYHLGVKSASKRCKTHLVASQSMRCKACRKYFVLSVQRKRKFVNNENFLDKDSTPKLHQCTLCEKSFKTRGSLKEHESLHTGEKPYLCSFCSKTFSRSNHLTRHMRIHTGEKPYECAVCGRSFSQKSHMVDHFKTHTGEKPYNCTRCGKCFIRNSDLNKHIRTHTGDRPYRCLVCNRGFAQKGQLGTHEKVHLVVKSRQYFPCGACGKVFSHRTNLNRHQKKHVGWKDNREDEDSARECVVVA